MCYFNVNNGANKTDRHDITEILLKVVLNTINQTRPNVNIAYKFELDMFLIVTGVYPPLPDISHIDFSTLREEVRFVCLFLCCLSHISFNVIDSEMAISFVSFLTYILAPFQNLGVFCFCSSCYLGIKNIHFEENYPLNILSFNLKSNFEIIFFANVDADAQQIQSDNNTGTSHDLWVS